MSRLEALKELVEKVEAGETWRLSRASHFVPLGDPDCLNWALRAYGGSLDAALALHEAVLPGWPFEMRERAVWTNRKRGLREPGYLGEADTPARAWLLAVLRALIAQEEAQ